MSEPKTKKTVKKQKTGSLPLIQAVKGMSDILPKNEDWWKYVWQAGFSVSELHDFHYIETPILEFVDLFERGVGGGTDIVEKQMYTLKTKGGDHLALRPEGTASIMRSYMEHHLGYYALPLKVFYYGPMFRHERPQAGRERQFHQWGFEIVGDSDPIYDAEVIVVALNFLNSLKLKPLNLKINSVGCRVCRGNYRDKLRAYYQTKKGKICGDCERRLEKNPLRLLDCTEKDCREVRKDAPIILDFLCQNCNNHLKSVLEIVEDNGIPYEPDPYLVRGLDYYNRTVFEIWSPSFDSALAGGGRYDYLSEMISGRTVPAVGVALGLERIIETLQKLEVVPALKSKHHVFFAAVGDQARKGSVRLMNILRHGGIAVIEAVGKKSLKSQLKAANKSKVPFALIYGQKEVFEKSVIIRDMRSGAQETLMIEKFVDEVKQRFKSV
ncbi:MAG: histidine--tRNA ligase [Patescibacteria group bacterium]